MAGASALSACGGDASAPSRSQVPVEKFKVAHTLRVGGGGSSARRASGPPVVLASAYERLVMVSISGGERRPVAVDRAARDGLKPASWAPDGRSFVVPVGYDRHTRERLLIEHLPAGRLTTIRDPVLLAPYAAAFSPDGRYLVMAADAPAGRRPTRRPDRHHHDPRGLYAYDLRRHRRVRLLDGPVSVGNLSWSPDGTRIAFTSDTLRQPNGAVRKCCDSYDGDKFVGGIVVLDLRRGTVRQLTREGSDPAFSPDGRRIAFVSRQGGAGRRCGEDGCDVSNEIHLIGTEGRDPRRITHTSADEGGPSWSPDGSHLVAEAASGDYYSGRSRLVTLRVDGSCYRALTRALSSEPALGPNSWRPVRDQRDRDPGC